MLLSAAWGVGTGSTGAMQGVVGLGRVNHLPGKSGSRFPVIAMLSPPPSRGEDSTATRT